MTRASGPTKLWIVALTLIGSSVHPVDGQSLFVDGFESGESCGWSLTQPMPLEVCDGADNDCNGVADNDNPVDGVPCDTGLSGVCASGVTDCSGPQLVCEQLEPATVETCDTLDNDCNGQVDEGTSDINNCGACGVACVKGLLVINELMIDPEAVLNSAGEWIELYNPNSFDVAVDGFHLSDLGTDDHLITSSERVVAPALGYLVLGINADVFTNGGAPVDYEYSGFVLGNSGDEILLSAFGVEIDRLEWPGSFDSTGASKELSVTHRTADANDDLGKWCDAVTPYGDGDLGSPGLPNDCALP